ncbi:MAG: hypothetical protein KC476_11690 [Cyanobacteria bacterium HKST-UBA06]|nr:hypothetical protein [Cyanobacteria bacterium HKST-UBA05]MCA9798925.1 hypothetical protein [Cyanobacteria bacterium HKST-UBA04]MCA9808606.1 hypothetical protein [Cyanobacteria bacterium HKST-UBA06]MCA9840837.1 hypothetical protein [Cyanobacteria bacterium HKST-UBA03]
MFPSNVPHPQQPNALSMAQAGSMHFGAREQKKVKDDKDKMAAYTSLLKAKADADKFVQRTNEMDGNGSAMQ